MTHHADAQSLPRAEVSQRHGRAVLIAALTALPAPSIDMSLPGLPDLAVGLDASPASAQLTIGVFLAGFAVAQRICGPLSDRFGRRPVLLAGLGLFALAGLCCAMAPTLPALLACRALQGVGACVGPVLARAIIRDLYSGEAAAVQLARATTIMALAPVLAPSLGTVVLAFLDWRAISLVLSTFGLALLLAVAATLPETISAKDHTALMPRVLARNATGFFRCRQAISNALVVAFLFGGMFAYVAASPFALMDVLGVSTTAYSGLFAVTALGIMAGSSAAPRAARAVGRARLVLAGLAVSATAALCLLALATFGKLGVAGLVALYTFTRGLVVPLATAAALEPMGRTAGLASGLLGALQMAGAAVAACAAGLFGNSLVGVGVTLAVFGAGALVCGLWAEGVLTRRRGGFRVGPVTRHRRG